jgi:hypothetical protein
MNPRLVFCAHGPSWPELKADIEALDAAREGRCRGYTNGCECGPCLGRNKRFAERFEATAWEKGELHRLGEDGYYYVGTTDDDFLSHTMLHPTCGLAEVTSAETAVARDLMRHATSLGLTCSAAKAKGLMEAHKTYFNARRALNRLAQRVPKRKAA